MHDVYHMIRDASCAIRPRSRLCSRRRLSNFPMTRRPAAMKWVPTLAEPEGCYSLWR